MRFRAMRFQKSTLPEVAADRSSLALWPVLYMSYLLPPVVVAERYQLSQKPSASSNSLGHAVGLHETSSEQ